MLELILGGTEGFDETTSEYVTQGGKIVQFEHSLLSLSKWESKFEKPFLGAEKKSDEEMLTYIAMMCQTPEFSPSDFGLFTQEHFDKLADYINSSQTATTFTRRHPEDKKPKQLVTSELIYYWMISCKIPFTCETWFLGRLLTLVQVCQAKQEEAQAAADRRSGKRRHTPMSTAAKISRAELNAQRKAQLGTTG